MNGSRGVITGFEERYDVVSGKRIVLPVVQFDRFNGKERRIVVGVSRFEKVLDGESVVLVRKQLPLKLGWFKKQPMLYKLIFFVYQGIDGT